jgi:hypothetical protein
MMKVRSDKNIKTKKGETVHQDHSENDKKKCIIN